MPRRTILVIDDHDDLRRTLDEKLTAAGYRVVTVASGHEASQAFAREKPDLVLTDLLMPDQDGLQAVGELRQFKADVPVIAMAGGGRAPAGFYAKLADALGARTILEKPFSNEQLLTTVALALPEASG